ncbi:CAP domain-containing protein [Pseudanabaena sp. 'Roaring Creek']|uniref:CAP domain-containing protein n=1 Tax=Pseudanabaena sp. 'Roaring Creek' TaxID=1681830 RepID=UPI0006D82DE2|nr:CAP domain-containing protein [Pseudanabaena sp. 'Roaring Creek']
MTKQQAIAIGILGFVVYISYVNNKDISRPPSLGNGNQSIAVDKNNAPDANVVIFSPEEDSKKAINDINEVRKRSGLTPLNYSTKAYQLATARAKDMNQYNYFDFTNPQTKTCTDNMKLGFGFTSEEFLAESNIRYVPVGANIGASTKNVSEVSREWAEQMASSDQNFLFPNHVAGAVGCDGNKCVFLALNYSGYGKGCRVKRQ